MAHEESLTSRRESEFFDELVRESGDFDPFADRAWRTLASRFAAIVRNAKPARLLDVGCGTGQSRRIYQEIVSSYVGADLSLVALRCARLRSPSTPWLRADACTLPFAGASFDAVAFSSVLHHIPNRLAALREAYRVLRPGGIVFAFDPNLLNPPMAIFRHPRSPLYRPEGVSPNERPLLPGELRRDFIDAGFADPGQRAQSDIPYRAVAVPALNALLGAYNVADWLLERTGLGRFIGTFVVTWATKPAEVRS